MTSEERTEVLLTSRLLQAAADMQWLSIGFTLIAALAYFFQSPQRLWPLAVVVLGLVVNYYGFRIHFDASLFEDAAAERITAEGIDAALVSLSLSAEGKSTRSWSDRCSGAKRLVTRCAIVLLIQTVAVAAAGFLR